MQPPLNLFGLPARYASALYTAASKQDVLSEVQAEFKSVSVYEQPTHSSITRGKKKKKGARGESGALGEE